MYTNYLVNQVENCTRFLAPDFENFLKKSSKKPCKANYYMCLKFHQNPLNIVDKIKMARKPEKIWKTNPVR